MKIIILNKRIRFIIVFLIICSLAIKVESQSKLFSSTNSKWHQYIDFSTPLKGGYYVRYYYAKTFLIKDDTTVNNQIYQKVYYAGNHDRIDTSCYQFYSFIYNANNKIYAGKFLDSMNLVYDFNLVVGDSFEFHGSSNYNMPVPTLYHPKVDSISTIYYAGKWRKYIQFELLPYGTRFSWLEGVGDKSYGLLPDLYTIMLYNSFPGGTCKLDCFSDGETLSDFGTCHYQNCGSVNVNNIGTEIQKLSIYPNPIKSNIINIYSNFKIEECHIFDAIGNAYSTTIHREKDYYQIQIRNILNPGMYFLEIKNGGERITKKVIVQ